MEKHIIMYFNKKNCFKKYYISRVHEKRKRKRSNKWEPLINERGSCTCRSRFNFHRRL